MKPASPIDLEFLPDWARLPSTDPSFSEEARRSPRDERNNPARDRTRNKGRRSEHPARSQDPKSKGRAPKFSIDRRTQIPQTPLVPLPIEISFLPELKALESVIEQIRASARAYPLFSIARMFLEKPERHDVEFRLKKDAQTPTAIYQCTLCHRIAIHRSAIAEHMLRQHKDAFYKEDRQQGELPKGNFTSVARCSLNGAIVGPSNHHSYQTRLLQLYKANFAQMPFDRFKNSIIQVRDPEVVKKWMEEQSWKSTWSTVQEAEPKTLHSETEVERHFADTHFSTAVRQGRAVTVPGEISRTLDNPALAALLRQTWEVETRFPVRLAYRLRDIFFKNNLHVFKGRKSVQFVSLVRPKALVLDPTIISPGLKAILAHLAAHPQSTRKSLIETLAPETQEKPNPDAKNAVLQDLHWLIRQGHLIEYNNALLEITRPPKKKEKPAKPVENTQAGAAAGPTEPTPVAPADL